MTATSTAKSIPLPLYMGVGLVLFCYGSYFRFSGLYSDLWLDEIWTITAILKAESLFEFWREIEWDGFFSLSSLYLFLIGEQPEPYRYRLLSFLAGILGMILVLALHTERGRRIQGIFLLGFLSSSYLYVLYDSEARGYAPMLALGLASFYIIHYLMARSSKAMTALFWLISIAAFLFHASYIFIFISLFLWTAISFLCRESFLKTCIELAWIFLLPATLLGLLYGLVLLNLPSAGGPISSYPDVILSALSVTFGGPLITTHDTTVTHFALNYLIMATLLILCEMVMLVKDKDKVAIFYFSAILIIPATVLWILSPEYIAVRYFLPSVLAIYLLMSGFLNRLFQQGLPGQILSLILLYVFFHMNVTNYLIDFVHYGRGHYEAALRYITDNSTQEPTTIAGDNNFRNHMMVEFYSTRLDLDPLLYIDQPSFSTGAAQWYLLHSQDRAYQPPESIILDEDLIFEFEMEFPHTALSGWSWFLYRRQLNQPVQASVEAPDEFSQSALP